MSDTDDLRDAGYSVDGNSAFSWLDKEAPNEVYTVDNYYTECHTSAGAILEDITFEYKNMNRFLLVINLLKEYELGAGSTYKYYISIHGIYNFTNERIQIGKSEPFVELAECMDIAEAMVDIVQGISENITIKHVCKKLPKLEQLLIELKKDRDARFEEEKKKYLLEYQYNNGSVCYQAFWSHFDTVDSLQPPF